MQYPEKVFPKDLENRLTKLFPDNNTALALLLVKDEQVIDIVRSHSDTACAAWQSLIDKRLAGICYVPGCSGDDEWGCEDGSYHEDHIDYAVTQRDATKRYYDRLLADLDATFTEWRNESVTGS